MNINLCAQLSKTSLKRIEFLFLIIILYFKDQETDFLNFYNNEKRKEKRKKIKKYNFSIFSPNDCQS